MYSKALLIAIAAFAVTATGAQAFGGAKLLTRAGLTEQQIEAFETARELRGRGEPEQARNVLIEAGVTEETLVAIRHAANLRRSALHSAITDNDYRAFRDAVADMPLGDIITTEADFQQFRDAHALHAAGERIEAEEIFADLGVARPHQFLRDQSERHHHRHHPRVTATPWDAWRAALTQNDRDTAAAVLSDIEEDDTRGHRTSTRRHTW
jgi:hypothetical protein